jgi:protein-arginine kinase activator protein McsA
MNAKTAQRLESIKKGTYVCQKCQTQFKYASGDLKCPKCNTMKAEDLVPFYMENDPERDEMLSRDEFAAGD